ncbi:MAG: ABC transporter ATP-binding protein [Clostridia bacterium]|nr:ABC transporter ATP-binding protein [Clostridia bacterium]
MLKINNLTKHYPGSTKGVTDLTLHIEKGDIYAFIGPNGAGKTTALKAVTGIHGFDGGEIIIDGIRMSDDPIACKAKLAYIPDNPDIYEYLTGIQYLNFIADIFEIPADERKEKIEKYATEYEILSSLGDLVSTYSHGMRQKLAIISALIHSPKLLILDEPFVGLDPKASVILKEEMREFCRNGGAVFFSTHVLDTAEKLCNKVAIIKDGRIVAQGNMTDVVADKKSLEDIFMEVAVGDE